MKAWEYFMDKVHTRGVDKSGLQLTLLRIQCDAHPWFRCSNNVATILPARTL